MLQDVNKCWVKIEENYKWGNSFYWLNHYTITINMFIDKIRESFAFISKFFEPTWNCFQEYVAYQNYHEYPWIKFHSLFIVLMICLIFLHFLSIASYVLLLLTICVSLNLFYVFVRSGGFCLHFATNLYLIIYHEHHSVKKALFAFIYCVELTPAGLMSFHLSYLAVELAEV